MKSAIFFIFFLISSPVWSQVNDAEAFFNGSYDRDYIRKHKLKQVVVQIYIRNLKAGLQLFDFDKDGFLSKQSTFDSSGNKESDYIFTYDKLGHQIERKEISYTLNKSYVTSITNTYNNSLLVQVSSSEQSFITRHIYDAAGQRIRSITFLGADSNAAPKRVNDYRYDAKGKLTSIRETVIKNSGVEPIDLGTTEYFYDIEGQLTLVTRKNKATYEYNYDEKGLLKMKKTKMPEEFNGLELVDHYTYRF